MTREILGLSVPATKREQGFALAGFLLGTAANLGLWLVHAL